MFFLWQVKRTNGTALWICSTAWTPSSPPLCHSFILFFLSVSPSLSTFPKGSHMIFCLDSVCLYESDFSDSTPPPLCCPGHSTFSSLFYPFLSPFQTPYEVCRSLVLYHPEPLQIIWTLHTPPCCCCHVLFLCIDQAIADTVGV